MSHIDPTSPQLQSSTIKIERGWLLCPYCDDTYLHHSEVTAFSRPVEDGPVTATMVHSGGTVRVMPGQWKGNPSSRRYGIAIRFSCESCGRSAELTIAQDKGETAIKWRAAR